MMGHPPFRAAAQTTALSKDAPKSVADMRDHSYLAHVHILRRSIPLLLGRQPTNKNGDTAGINHA
jgi:isocitrate dehydrogenase kinase/phosphatase